MAGVPNAAHSGASQLGEPPKLFFCMQSRLTFTELGSGRLPPKLGIWKDEERWTEIRDIAHRRVLDIVADDADQRHAVSIALNHVDVGADKVNALLANQAAIRWLPVDDVRERRRRQEEGAPATRRVRQD